MTEGQPHSTSSAWRERLVALRNVPPVLGILWKSGRAVVTWGLILRVLVAALPAGIGIVAAWILNGVENAILHKGLPQYFWWAVGAEVVLNVIVGLLSRGIDYSDSLLADRYTHFVSVQVMQQAAQLDLTTYEDPVFYDRLERGQASAEDIDTLLDLSENILGKSFCALGDGATSPVTSSIKYFRDEYVAHYESGGCPFRRDRTLVGAH